MKTCIKSETAPDYGKQDVIKLAIAKLENQLANDNVVIESPTATKEYLFLQLAAEECEYFSMLLLDTRHRVISFERLFRGTIDGASVHPREVVKHCLANNAAAVILSHNHPSGNPEPSQADIKLTRRLVDSLALIDVRVLDHIVIGNNVSDSVSFAERGLI